MSNPVVANIATKFGSLALYGMKKSQFVDYHCSGVA